MMKVIVLGTFLLVSLNSLHVRQTKLNTQSLKEWLSDERGFHLLLTPQYNNQHSIFGVTEFLQQGNLLKDLRGVSAGSGGSLPGAFAAAGSNFSLFQEHFPKVGWGGLGPAEPKITQDYMRILAATLPKTFEELRYPLGLSLTHWNDLESLKNFDHTRQRGFAVSTGNLHEAMVAAVTTSGAHKSCPYCSTGFWPRRIENKFPVTDGAFGDIWGSKGLSHLPRSEKILHLLPLDYPGQVEPPSLSDVEHPPSEMVSLVLVQPPVASHAYLLEKHPVLKSVSSKSSADWNTAMFQSTHTAMSSVIADKIDFSSPTVGRCKHAVVNLDGGLTSGETLNEQIYDRVMSFSRDQFWSFYGGEGKGAWGMSWDALSRAALINQKLWKKHSERWYADVKNGNFGIH